MASAPDDPQKRSVWYQARAAECRRFAGTAKLNAIRVSYEKMAESNDALAAEAEHASRRNMDLPTN
jgi:hypothetical protein